MRAIFVLPGFSRKPIGGYRVIYEYCNALAEQGWDVRISYAVLPLRNESRRPLLARLLAHARNSIVRITYARRNGTSSVPWFNLDPRVRTTSRPRVARRWCVATSLVIGTEVSTWAEMRALSGRSASSAPVIFLQSYEEWAASPQYLDSYLQDRDIRKIAISDWLVCHVERCGDVALKVANAVDSSDFPLGPALAKRPLKVIAMVSPVAEKRSDIVFDVFRRLSQLGVEMVTFGVKGLPEGAPAGLQHFVQPSRRLLSKLLQEARVFICASDYEGWGLPPAEALLSGTAVVSTRNGGVEDYAEGAALFSDRGDAVRLAENAIRLVTDVALAQELTDIGRYRLLQYAPREAGIAFADALQKVADGA